MLHLLMWYMSISRWMSENTCLEPMVGFINMMVMVFREKCWREPNGKDTTDSWHLEKQEGFPICLYVSIACTRNESTVHMFCKGNTNAMLESQPSSKKSWHHVTCGFSTLSLEHLKPLPKITLYGGSPITLFDCWGWTLWQIFNSPFLITKLLTCQWDIGLWTVVWRTEAVARTRWSGRPGQQCTTLSSIGKFMIDVVGGHDMFVSDAHHDRVGWRGQAHPMNYDYVKRAYRTITIRTGWILKKTRCVGKFVIEKYINNF